MVVIRGEKVPWPEEVEVDLPNVRLIQIMVEISSTGSKFMVMGEKCLEGCVGADGGEVNEGRGNFGVSKSLHGEILEVVIGESGGEIFGDDR
nr:hypothetical protein [Tanacetum cinerariifolium]